MAVESNQHPLIDAELYEEIRERFVLPKDEQGRMRYVQRYAEGEPVLAERMEGICRSIAEAYIKDMVAHGMTLVMAKKVAKALAKDLQTVGWFGYLFSDRARDVTWERDMRESWQKDWRPPDGWTPEADRGP